MPKNLRGIRETIEKIKLLDPQLLSTVYSKEFMIKQLYYHKKWWDNLSDYEKHKIMKIIEENESA